MQIRLIRPNCPLFLIMSLLAGALASGGFAPVGLPICTAAGLAVLFWCVVSVASSKVAFASGFLWGLSYFSLGLSWTYQSMHVFGGLPGWMAAGGVVLLAALLSTVTALVGWGIRVIPASPVFRLALVAPAVWTIGELVRGVYVFGFGWLSVGYAFSSDLLAGWAPIAGVYGVSFAVTLIIGTVLAAMTQKTGPVTKLWLSLLIGVVALGSFVLERLPWSQDSGSLQVRVVQPDLPVVMQGNDHVQSNRLARMQSMSERTPLGPPLDLIVWPESIYLAPLQRLSWDFVHAPIMTAKKTSATVLFNAFDEPVPGRFYNALWFANPDTGSMSRPFAKHHLVPFGEFVPWGFRWFVDAMGIPMADQQRGEIPTMPVVVAGEQVALGVCYENMFGEELRKWFVAGNSGNTPSVIINVANLGWFSDSALEQFTQMSIMRAKEMARPFVQAVNNAGSVYIDANGSIVRQATAGAQNLDLTVRLSEGRPTPFVQFGLLPVWAGTLFALLLAYVSARRRPLCGPEKSDPKG